MPDPILGLNRDEVVAQVLDSIGRTGDTALQTRLNTDINFAQLAFWKMLDWKFAYKDGLTDLVKFDIATGQSVYTLNTATVGFEIRNTDIDKLHIIDPAYQRTLDKVSSRDIRIADPGRQVLGPPTCYAGIKHNQVEIWPIPDLALNGIAVYVDAKVMPAWIAQSTDYTSIPVEYQETFIQYFLYRTLSRERDPRQTEELQIFKDMLKTDIQYDLREVENTLHIKLPEEEASHGGDYPGMSNILKNFNRDFY